MEGIRSYSLLYPGTLHYSSKEHLKMCNKYIITEPILISTVLNIALKILYNKYVLLLNLILTLKVHSFLAKLEVNKFRFHQ